MRISGKLCAFALCVFVGGIAFAEPTELDKKTVASKAYVDTKQDKITTGNIIFYDDPDGTEGDIYVPGLVAYDPQTSTLSGNKIGILDQDTILDHEGLLYVYGYGDYGSEMDNFVPTVRAVAEDLSNLYEKKQDNLPAAWTSITGYSNMASTGGQTIELNTAGKVKRRYITAGGNAPLTRKTGADNVILYINGTKTLAEYQTSNFGATGSTATTNQNYIKNALVSLELLKDVYNALHNEIQNAAPTGTPGNVAMYDTSTGALGDGVATANAPTHNATTGELENGANIATIAAVDTRQKKRTCAGYETGHENDPDYCWLWDFPDD
ncbi:MAG: hypothetical protein J5714_04375 [Alphaproteobacteria bacterium]|nr:hypothetical protein [Alphaproteobacteria bacterium]